MNDPVAKSGDGRSALRTIARLAQAGLLPSGADPELQAVQDRYAVSVTPSLVRQMDVRNRQDPVRMQFVPDVRELITHPEDLADPIGDDAFSQVPGLVHRYPDRVLLKVTQTCAVYCRFCFRREQIGPGASGGLAGEGLDDAVAYIRGTPAIREVILTGGDPLVLSARRLSLLLDALDMIPHLEVVRIHSRVPVAEPDRIDDDLVGALSSRRCSVWLAVHANHAAEFGDGALSACRRLRLGGVNLVSQSVLLRGVNDSSEALVDLMRCFVSNGIKPYYLHHPDLAPGTAHWRLPLDHGMALVAGLRGQISGLCQPTYVLDIPGGFGKIVLSPDVVRRTEAGATRVRDRFGNWHDYPDMVFDPVA